MKKNNPLLFLKLSRPLFLLAGFGQYLLGAGIARYLGNQIDWNILFLGLFWVIFIQLATHYLNEYFDAPLDESNENRSWFTGGSGVLGKGEDKLDRKVALIAFSVVLSFAVAIILMLAWAEALNPGVSILMLLIVFGSILYSLPPVQFSRRGYGELVTAILVGYLVPSLGYSLQTGQMHNLIIMTTLPLVFLIFALMIIISFPDYVTDMRHGKKTLLVWIGWENVMVLHNSLVALAYVTLAGLIFIGFPKMIALSAFLSLPLGLLQIWQLRSIAMGGKPNWNALGLNAISTVGVMVYMLAYLFWTR